MPFTDMPLDELRRFKPAVREPGDFDRFWDDTLAESRQAAERPGAAATRVPAHTPVTELLIEDLTFPGFAAEPVKGWVMRPKGRDAERLPAVIEYLGYNGGRGLPGETVRWALSGYVHVLMDTRGQGSGWGSQGDTPDPHGSGPSAQGWMTRGILDPREHFYRRVFTDAARLIDEVKTWDFVDPERIAVTGGSQGGGIAIAAAGLTPGLWALLPDVAFLCAWEHAASVATTGPFDELATYLAVHRGQIDAVWDAAAYFDGVNFAQRVTAPALFSVALMDDVVPPSTTFAAYNRLSSADKHIEVYPYNNHSGGGGCQWFKQAAFLADRR